MVAFGVDRTRRRQPLGQGFKRPSRVRDATWAATSPQLDGWRVYCEDCDIAEVVPEGEEFRGGVVCTAKL